MEIGLFLLRLVLAAILFTHATQKLFGWFKGNGVTKQGQIFAAMGLKPGRVMVMVAGLSELVAAVLLFSGLGTALGALIAAATMLVAGLTMQLNSGQFWNVTGGGEYPYVLASLAVVLGFTGAGSFSADALLAQRELVPFDHVAEPSVVVGIAVVVLALLAAIPFAMVIRRNRDASSSQSDR